MEKEIEAKFLRVDKDAVRSKLKMSRFILKTPEYLMRRKTFDFSRIPPIKINGGAFGKNPIR